MASQKNDEKALCRRRCGAYVVGDRRHAARFSAFADQIASFRLPRYEEIPNLDLYMDQLIGYIDEHVRLLLPEGEKGLTSAMVNNYVKQGLVPQPKAKRYTPDHVAYLLVVVVLKRTLSLAEIDQLVSVQIGDVPTARAYDFFITAFEESLRALFCGNLEASCIGECSFDALDGYAFSLRPVRQEELNPARRLALSAATCAANGIYVAKNLEFAQERDA